MRPHPIQQRNRVTPEQLLELGTTTRSEVLGIDFPPPAAGTEKFFNAYADSVVRWCWGEVWNRPGLDRASRSVATLAILVTLGKQEEIRLHVRAALRNGLSADEIREVILHATVYAGVPAGGSALQTVLATLKDLGELPKEAQ